MNKIEAQGKPATGAPDRDSAEGTTDDGADLQRAIEERAKKDERTVNDGPVEADAR